MCFKSNIEKHKLSLESEYFIKIIRQRKYYEHIM